MHKLCCRFLYPRRPVRASLVRVKAHKKECKYSPSQRGRRNREKDRTTLLETRLARMETLMQVPNQPEVEIDPQISLHDRLVAGPVSPSYLHSPQRGKEPIEYHRGSVTETTASPTSINGHNRRQTQLGNAPFSEGRRAAQGSFSSLLSRAPTLHPREYVSSPYVNRFDGSSRGVPADTDETILSPQKVCYPMVRQFKSGIVLNLRRGELGTPWSVNADVLSLLMLSLIFVK